MRTRALVLTLAALTSGAIAKEPPPVMTASDAVAVAAGLGSRLHHGRYEMTVVATERTANATFLNSTADYRAPDNLTFRVAPIVAKMLTKRYGAPPEVFFKGRTLTVDGDLGNQPIYNSVAGRAHDFNRYQHEVRIDQVAQIVAIR